MPRRSSLFDLPTDLLTAFNRKLVEKHFSDYTGLTEWLNGALKQRGMELVITRSSANRHGQKFQEKLERVAAATEKAKAIVAGSPDDAGAMNDALIRMVQSEMFEVLLAIEELDDPQKAAGALNKIALSVSRTTRASVNQKEFARGVQEKTEAAAAAIGKQGRQAGLSEDTIREMEEKVLGIVR